MIDFIIIFLKIFWLNFFYIVPVSLVFLTTTVVGILILACVVKENNWKILIPAGILTGVFSFIVFLATFSYLFKGRTGIAIIFVSFLLLGFLLWRRLRKTCPPFKFIWSKETILMGVIYFLTVILLLLTAGNNVYGGDVMAYWGFATSFANGNYPLHSPWQPDLLANHHQGAYLYQGAVQALTGVDMRLIHSLFAALVVSGGFFLIWGWVKKLTNLKFWSILPALVMYISFGAIFIPLPSSITGYLNPETTHSISRLPTLDDAKPRLGGAANLNGLFYLNHRAAALGGLMLLIILLIVEFRIKEYWRPIIAVVLSAVVISTDEITLPAVGASLVTWSVCTLIQKRRTGKIKLLTTLAISSFVFILMFFVTGSALRDSLLTPSPEVSRFQMLFSQAAVFSRIGGLKSIVITTANSGWIFFLPDLRVIIFLSMLVIIFIREFWTILLFTAGIGTIVAYFIVEHTFYPGNEGRFLDFMYPLFGLIISFSVVKLIALYKKKLFNLIIISVGLILFVPSVLFGLIYVGSKASSNEYPNMYGMLPNYPILKWAKDNIPNKRIFFIDGFLKGEPFSYLGLYGTQDYGLMVPIGPAFVRVHTPNWGPEAIDVVNTLNPLPLKELKIDYVFITYDQIRLFPKSRQDDFGDPRYFIKTYSDELGVLLKIREVYLVDGKNIDGSIAGLVDLIKRKQGNIYLDYPPHLNYYLWTTSMLALKDSGSLFTKLSRQGYDYIETKIYFRDPSLQHSFDYLVLSPETDPYAICNCIDIEKIWQTNGVVAYKVK